MFVEVCQEASLRSIPLIQHCVRQIRLTSLWKEWKVANARMTIWVMGMVCVLLVADMASARLVQDIGIDFVTIGNAGNPGDTRAAANPTGGGAVDYVYQIGKYEITNGQWDMFVSAAGAPTGNRVNGNDPYDNSSSWTGTNVPTNSVSWYEAAQFSNYLTSGDKSLGAYQFSGNNTNPGNFLGIDRDSAVSDYGIAYVIPTEDEWYKAAYYTGSGYSSYANGQETIPAADNSWNYFLGAYNSPWDVGTGTMEQNGTFDMMGNVWEWNEALIPSGPLPLFRRGVRGGAYHYYNTDWLISSSRGAFIPEYDGIWTGFRVASVPEPCSLVLLGLGGLVLRRKR